MLPRLDRVLATHRTIVAAHASEPGRADTRVVPATVAITARAAGHGAGRRRHERHEPRRNISDSARSLRPLRTAPAALAGRDAGRRVLMWTPPDASSVPLPRGRSSWTLLARRSQRGARGGAGPACSGAGGGSSAAASATRSAGSPSKSATCRDARRGPVGTLSAPASQPSLSRLSASAADGAEAGPAAGGRRRPGCSGYDRRRGRKRGGCGPDGRCGPSRIGCGPDGRCGRGREGCGPDESSRGAAGAVMASGTRGSGRRLARAVG
jgi:hypothetical protein